MIDTIFIFIYICVYKDQENDLEDKLINNPTSQLSFIFSLKCLAVWQAPEASYTQSVNSEQLVTRNKRKACNFVPT